jgi:ribosomal protein L28
MAGRVQTKNVYVDTEYDNIIVIDPNIVQNEDGSPVERLVQHEDLVYYANLETKIVPRTKLAVGETLDVVNTTVASFIGGDENQNLNFLKPKNKRGTFDTSWSDQLTGMGARGGAGYNQTTEQVSEVTDSNNKTKSVFNRNITNYQDVQTLGIKSISVSISAAGVPQVDMTLVDIQGRTLFEQGENSLYSIFFNLPYPAFYLTLKGYYGKAIRYQLALLSFNAKLDPKSGNFDISLKLMGRPGALLFDTLFGYGKNLPKMYKKEYIVGGNTSTSNQTGIGSQDQKKVSTTLGRQLLDETYSLYESKGLIPPNFPRLSIEDFMYRIENFVGWLQDDAPKGDFQILTEVYKFRKDLETLKTEVFDNSVNNYLDLNNVFSINDQYYYPFKNEINKTVRDAYKKDIKNITTLDDSPILKDMYKFNATFGKGGSYTINGVKTSSDIASTLISKLKYENIVKERDLITEPFTEKEYEDTFFVRTGKTKIQDPQGYNKFVANLAATSVALSFELDANFVKKPAKTTFFVFGTKDNTQQNLVENPPGFLQIIKDAEKELKSCEQDIEIKLSEIIAQKIGSSDKNGIGFIPTIRNVFAVLFAGIDSFYKLMDDTHRKAWEKREDRSRIDAILDKTKPSIERNDNDTNKIVYPWPQYYVQKNEDGRNLYEIQYPGDPQYVNQTKGNNFTIWPEVEFTEQYLAAASTKLSNADNSVYTDPTKLTKKSQLNSIYKTNNPYFNTNRSNFLFEILERSYVNAYYGKFNYANYKNYQLDKLIADLEAENIIDSIINILPLIDLFKNYEFNNINFKDYLKTNFIRQWWYYENNLFSTSDLSVNLVPENQNSLFSLDYLTKQQVTTTSDLQIKFQEYLKDTASNEESFLDTYPFTNGSWLISNIADGINAGGTESFRETTKIFKIEEGLKKVARLDTNYDGQEVNMFVNNKIFDNSNVTLAVTNSSGQPIPVNTPETLKQFYEQRVNDPNSFVFTETAINYGNEYNGQVKTKIQTTSLLNAPYFVNAIMNGVELEKTSGQTPYAALGYLYLNSLPLITTREKLKTVEAGEQSDLDYLASSFNKLSAIHQVPYAWVLKYGSIWHRYKKWVETGNDILDDVWKDFDAASAWDPSGNSKSKTYAYTNLTGGTSNVTLQQEIPGIPLGIPSVVKTYNVGFYPKVCNDLYYFFSKKDLFSAYTGPDLFIPGNDRVGRIGLNRSIAPTINNSYEQTLVKSISTQYRVTNDTNLSFWAEDSYLYFPSFGDGLINQAIFECFDENGVEKIQLKDNPAFYNGTVKSLWEVPHYGYYDNSKIKKPQPWEYIKKIKTSNEDQSSFDLLNNSEEYNTIEEIFGIFNKETLDIFEKRFLLFIDPKSNVDTYFLEDEFFSGTLENPPIIKNSLEKTLYSQMKNLFVVPDNFSQLENFTARAKEFLDFDVILRIGNPGNFDRQIFNEFTNSPKYLPTNDQVKYKYNPYSGNLPPQVTIAQSKESYPEEWKALQLYVGFSTISGLDYNGTSSTITDFFKEMDIEFTVDNIQRFSQLIKLYVTNKIKDPTLDKTKFINLIIDFLDEKEVYQQNLIDETFSYLRKNLKDVTSNQTTIQSPVNGNVIKLETYSTLKTLNDKWIAGSELQDKTIFEDFLFYDRANSDIGNTFTIDVTQLKSLLESSDNRSMMNVVSSILDKNHFLFFAMPAYINFYNLQKAVREDQEIPYEIPNSMFGTYLNVDYINSKPKFLCMYIGNTSEHLANDSEFNKFGDDVLDLRKTTNSNRRSSENIDKEKENLVCAFNVDFGVRNQNMFSDLTLDMAEKQNTAESIRLEAELANSASANKVAQQSTSLYSIYRTRSYSCGVTSMGNAMIQPTMYFNLRHVPLFRGAYFINEVKHNIDNKSFKTEFKGVRIPIYTLPKPDSYVASINKNLLERVKVETIKTGTAKWELSTGFTRNPNATVNNTPLLDTIAACKSNVASEYELIPFVDSETTKTTDSILKDRLNDLINTDIIPSTPLLPIFKLLKTYLFGIANVCISNRVDSDVIFSFNHNLFSFQTSSVYGGAIADTYIAKQTCAKVNNYSTPIIAFDNDDQSINMAISLLGGLIPIVPEIANKITIGDNKDKYSEALARLYIETFENVMVDPDANKVYDGSQSKLDSGLLSEAAFKNYVDIFKESYGYFF